MAKETIKDKIKINNIEQNHILYSCCNIQILLFIYFFDLSPDLFPLLQAMLIFCNTCSFSISLDMSTTHITWSKAGKMCYKNIYEFFKPAGFLATKHDILQNDSMLKYICPLIFVQDWSSVLNQKKKKKKKFVIITLFQSQLQMMLSLSCTTAWKDIVIMSLLERNISDGNETDFHDVYKKIIA